MQTGTLNVSGMTLTSTTNGMVSSGSVYTPSSPVGPDTLTVQDSMGNSPTLNVLVGSITTVSSSATSPVFGQTVTFTAMVTTAIASFSLTPTGTVDFYDSTTGQDLGDGQNSGGDIWTLSTSSLAVTVTLGDVIVATYQNDPNFSSSSGAATQIVNAVTPNNVQAAINANSSSLLDVQANSTNDANNIIDAVTGLSNQYAPVTLILNVGSNSFSETPTAPSNVTLVIVGSDSTTVIGEAAAPISMVFP